VTPSETVFRRRRDVRFRIVAPEAVVVRQSGPEVLVLNDVGARILERVDTGQTVAALVAGLAQEYDVDPGRLESDVVAFLEELTSSGVIERTGTPDAG
jgi:hypothetical protein